MANWNEQGESPYPYERDALAWVRSWFPEHEPWRAFARFTFPGRDGRDHEIDLLVAGPTGCFLIEFNGHEGRISGGARDLVSTVAGRRSAFEHYSRGERPARKNSVLTRVAPDVVLEEYAATLNRLWQPSMD